MWGANIQYYKMMFNQYSGKNCFETELRTCFLSVEAAQTVRCKAPDETASTYVAILVGISKIDFRLNVHPADKL